MFSKFLGLGLDTHNGVVNLQDQQLVKIDRPRVLPDIAGTVDASGQLLKLAVLDRLQRAYPDFCRLRDLFQGDGTPFSSRRELQIHHAKTPRKVLVLVELKDIRYHA